MILKSLLLLIVVMASIAYFSSNNLPKAINSLPVDKTVHSSGESKKVTDGILVDKTTTSASDKPSNVLDDALEVETIVDFSLSESSKIQTVESQEIPPENFTELGVGNASEAINEEDFIVLMETSEGFSVVDEDIEPVNYSEVDADFLDPTQFDQVDLVEAEPLSEEAFYQLISSTVEIELPIDEVVENFVADEIVPVMEVQ